MSRYVHVPLKELEKLYLKGCSLEYLADIFKCSRGTIANKLKRAGIPKRRKPCKISVVKARNLYLIDKMSTNEISVALGCDSSTVKRVLKEAGVKMRTKSESLRLYHKKNELYRR